MVYFIFVCLMFRYGLLHIYVFDVSVCFIFVCLVFVYGLFHVCRGTVILWI